MSCLQWNAARFTWREDVGAEFYELQIPTRCGRRASFLIGEELPAVLSDAVKEGVPPRVFIDTATEDAPGLISIVGERLIDRLDPRRLHLVPRRRRSRVRLSRHPQGSAGRVTGGVTA